MDLTQTAGVDTGFESLARKILSECLNDRAVIALAWSGEAETETRELFEVIGRFARTR